MSAKTVAWAVRQRVSSPAAKVVLIVLADAADPLHECSTLHSDEVAERAGMSRRSVRRQLASLRKRHLIRSERQYDGFGGRRQDRHILNVESNTQVTQPKARVESGAVES